MSDSQQTPAPEGMHTPLPTSTDAESEPLASLAGPAQAKKAAEPPMRSLEDVLRAVYRRDKKPRWPKASELPVIRGALGLQPETHAELLALAAMDRPLERTRALLLYCVDKLGDTALGQAALAFSRLVLERHPAFAGDVIRKVLRLEGEAHDIDAAVSALARVDYATLSEGDPPQRLTKQEVASCRGNAPACLLLWASEARGLDTMGTLRLLHTHVWPRPKKADKGERRRIWRLVAVRDGSSTALVYDLLNQQVSDAFREVVESRAVQERLSLRVRELDANLAAANESLAEARVEGQQLRESLAREQQGRADDRLHAQDDYERLRGRLLQRLRSEVTLLDEGLMALRREPPKVGVMVDHADRVLDGLKKEIGELEGK